MEVTTLIGYKHYYTGAFIIKTTLSANTYPLREEQNSTKLFSPVGSPQQPSELVG